MNYNIWINGQENPTLINKIDAFEITYNSGVILDTLFISIANSDYKYAVPAEVGADIKIALSEGEATLTDMGTFRVAKVESSSEHIYVYCVACLNVALAKDNKVRSFSKKTLQDILQTLASEMDLTLQLDSTFANTEIPYLEQNGRSNLQLIQQLAELFHAIIQISEESLVFIPNSALTKEITLGDCSILSIYTKNDNGFQYCGVQSNLWDISTGENTLISVGEAPYFYIHSSYSSESLLNVHLNSTLNTIKAKETLVIKTAGTPNLQAGFKLKLASNTVYPDYVGNWLIMQVKHTYAGQYSSELVAHRVIP